MEKTDLWTKWSKEELHQWYTDNPEEHAEHQRQADAWVTHCEEKQKREDPSANDGT